MSTALFDPSLTPRDFMAWIQLLKKEKESPPVLEAFLEWLQKNPQDIHFISKDRESALEIATKYALTDTVCQLIRLGASLNDCQAFDGRTALMKACYLGHASIAHELLHSGASTHFTDYSDRNALMLASSEGYLDIVQDLLPFVHLNFQNKHHQTALMYAATSGHSSIVRALIQAGADVNLQDSRGCTALLLAASSGRFQAFKELVHGHSDLNHQDQRGFNAFQIAVSRGWFDIVQVLIEEGVSLTPEDPYGRTALMLAPDVRTMECLLQAKADIHHTDHIGFTPLMHAVVSGFPTIQLLIQAGAHLNATSRKGQTALMLAAAAGSLEAARDLIQAGAHLNVQDLEGKTALMLASEAGYDSMVQLLIQSGADDRLLDHRDQTALDLAYSHRNSMIIDYLKSHREKRHLQQHLSSSKDECQSPSYVAHVSALPRL